MIKFPSFSKKNSAAKRSNEKKEKLNHHFIFIEAPVDLIWPQVMLWGEAGWWPQTSKMKFIRKIPGDIKVGTQYEQRLQMPFGASWYAEVTKLKANSEIERTFLNGMFSGYESVKLESYSNGTRIDYFMHYEICGIFNKILWLTLFRKLHDQNIERILNGLKEYVLTKQKEEQEKKFEG